MKLSNQFVGAVMIALQNSLMHQTDIQPVFEGWTIFMKDGELFVDNPPFVEIEDSGVTDPFAVDENDDILDFLTSPKETSEE